MVEGTAGIGAGTDRPGDDDLAAQSRARWGHLSDEEFAELQASADDPGTWPVSDDGLIEPIIGWSVVFPEDGTLSELLFRSEVEARRAAENIPAAVVSSFRTPDASWHQWRDAGGSGTSDLSQSWS